jgi:hypothetical protein
MDIYLHSSSVHAVLNADRVDIVCTARDSSPPTKEPVAQLNISLCGAVELSAAAYASFVCMLCHALLEW